jgi:two-component system cell cycle sensor histidine kinase/response regulator CckA
LAKPYDLELELVSAKGVRKWVRSIGHPKVENGNVVQVMGSFQDITERKHAEQHIEHLNRVLLTIRDVKRVIEHEKTPETIIKKVCRLLVDNRGYASALITLTDQKDTPVLWSSSGLAVCSDWLNNIIERGELPPCCDFECSEVQKDTKHGVILGRCDECPVAQSSGDIQSLCAQLLHDDRKFGYLVAALNYEVRIDDEEIELFAEMAEDLVYALRVLEIDQAHKESERRRKSLEGQLVQAQKMEAIGTLAGGIAHDFNNILSPILIHSELALMEVPQENPVYQNIRSIYKAGERARDLVKQILTFARIKEEDRIPLKTSVIVKEVIKFLRSTIPSTIDIRYEFNTEKEIIFADQTQLNQIVMNLCTNAAHAMEEKGGTLILILDNEDIDSEFCNEWPDLEPGPYVKLTVTDTGYGIDPEIMERIFEPYYTTKKFGKGTGMGLALVQSIVESYGGTITVESKAGTGTSFHIYFPLVEDYMNTLAVSDEDMELPVGDENILFIDDEQTAVDTFMVMLGRLGYKVTASTSSAEALEIFRSSPHEYDLVITDQTMPNITGKELAKKIISIRPDMPVILCTGFSEQINEKTAKDIGLSAFVMKPIVMKDIARTIREVLDNS